MTKIYLKNNWSEQFIYGDKTPGIFSGREHEINSLKSILIGNDSSSILISGVRGTGKTSFVNKTLSEIGENKILPFFVNIGHTIKINNQNNDGKKEILTSIIRSIYLNGNDKDEKLKELYESGIGKTTIEQNHKNTSLDEKSIGLNIKEQIGFNAQIGIALIGTIITVAAANNDWNTILKI